MHDESSAARGIMQNAINHFATAMSTIMVAFFVDWIFQFFSCLFLIYSFQPLNRWLVKQSAADVNDIHATQERDVTTGSRFRESLKEDTVLSETT